MGRSQPFAGSGVDVERQAYRQLGSLLATAWPDEAAPAAEALLAEFGSLAAVLAAPTPALRRCLGDRDRGIAAFLGVVARATAHVCSPRAAPEPVLADAAALIAYLKLDAAPPVAPGWRILHLNARNQLLGDQIVVADEGAAARIPIHAVLARALELGATALIVVSSGRRDAPRPAQLRETARLERAAKALDIVLHDLILLGRDGWRSFRQSGLLG